MTTTPLPEPLLHVRAAGREIFGYTVDQLQAYAAAVTAAKDAEIERLRAVVDAIYIYANDTLSGRTDGPDDRDWQRAAVVEIRNRARTLQQWKAQLLPAQTSRRANREHQNLVGS